MIICEYSPEFQIRVQSRVPVGQLRVENGSALCVCGVRVGGSYIKLVLVLLQFTWFTSLLPGLWFYLPSSNKPGTPGLRPCGLGPCFLVYTGNAAQYIVLPVLVIDYRSTIDKTSRCTHSTQDTKLLQAGSSNVEQAASSSQKGRPAGLHLGSRSLGPDLTLRHAPPARRSQFFGRSENSPWAVGPRP